MFSFSKNERNTILNKMFVNAKNDDFLFILMNQLTNVATDYWIQITSSDVYDCFVLHSTDHSVARSILDWERDLMKSEAVCL